MSTHETAASIEVDQDVSNADHEGRVSDAAYGAARVARSKFGWCIDSRHQLCRVHVGELACGCGCHMAVAS